MFSCRSSFFGVLMLGFCLLGIGSPAEAALPEISCTRQFGLNWCVSYDPFGYARAGVGNPGAVRNEQCSTQACDIFRVELVFYPYTPQARGERVFAGPDFYRLIAEGIPGVKHSPLAPGVNPGTYCARAYYPELGIYIDKHCVNHNGVIFQGISGSVTPRRAP